MTSPNRTRACEPGGCCGYLSFLSVLEGGEKEKGGGKGERGRRRWEKTRGASFDALNVQIYVEGQWSTFIRSFFLPPSHPAHWTSSTPFPIHPHFSLSHPCFPPQAFSFLPLLLILSHSVTHHHSPSSSPVARLSCHPPTLLCVCVRCWCCCCCGGGGACGGGGDWDCCGLWRSRQ